MEEFLSSSLPTKSPAFEAKAAALIAAHKCFMIKENGPRDRDRDRDREPKWMRRPPVNAEERRPVRFVPSTEEGLARKEFMPLMNKLTQKNKSAIMMQIKNIIRPVNVKVYIDIIWGICLDCPMYQALYVEALELVATASQDIMGIKKSLNERFCNFIDEEKYIPPAAITPTSTEEYDEFCDYMKWKKRALATISLLIILEKTGFVEAVCLLTKDLLDTCNEYLNAKLYEQADIILEQLMLIYTHGLSNSNTQPKNLSSSLTPIPCPYVDEITTFTGCWLPLTNQMRPSTRFKFYSFAETMERNSRNVNRWTSKTRLLQSLK